MNLIKIFTPGITGKSSTSNIKTKRLTWFIESKPECCCVVRCDTTGPGIGPVLCCTCFTSGRHCIWFAICCVIIKMPFLSTKSTAVIYGLLQKLNHYKRSLWGNNLNLITFGSLFFSYIKLRIKNNISVFIFYSTDCHWSNFFTAVCKNCISAGHFNRTYRTYTKTKRIYRKEASAFKFVLRNTKKL